MPFLAQVFRSPRKASRQSRPASLRVPPLISRLVTWQRMSFSDPLVFSGTSGLSSTISNSFLLARWRPSKRGLVAEDEIEPGRQDSLARRGRMAAPSLQIVVEQPDQAADALLRGALRLGERIEFVNQTFAMGPTQAVQADVELASVVADNHGIGEQAMRLDAAPQSAFAGDQHGIGADLQSRDAEPIQMDVPGRPVGEDAIGMLAEAGDDGSGERAAAHIGQGLFVDDVIVMSGPQQFEEVEAALRARGRKIGEMSVADLGAEAILAFVTRPGVVGRDPRRVGQAGPQYGARFLYEALLAGDQQTNDLSLGDQDANPSQQRDQSRRRDLSLMIQGEHEAAQFRSEMTVDARRQGRHQRLAVRGPPAFPQEVGDERADGQILNQKARIAFETRAGRSMGPELALVMDRQLCPRGASPPAFARRARRRRLAHLFHAARLDVRFDARLDVRPPRAALQPRDLVAERPDRSAKFRALVQKLQHQPFQVARRKRVDVRRRRHLPIDSDNRRFGNPPPGNFYPPHQQPNAKPTFALTFAPLTIAATRPTWLEPRSGPIAWTGPERSRR